MASVATTTSARPSSEPVASARASVGSVRSATSTNRYTGWGAVKGVRRPVTAHTSSSPGARKSSAASRVVRDRRRWTEASTAFDTVGEGQDGHGPVRQGRHQSEPGRRHHGQGPFAAAQQAGQVVPGVVLEQPAQVRDHRTGAQHRLHPEHLGPGVAVAEHPGAPGVGGDGPAHRGRIAAGQVDPVGPAR